MEKKEKETDLFYGGLESFLSATIAPFTAFFTAFFLFYGRPQSILSAITASFFTLSPPYIAAPAMSSISTADTFAIAVPLAIIIVGPFAFTIAAVMVMPSPPPSTLAPSS